MLLLLKEVSMSSLSESSNNNFEYETKLSDTESEGNEKVKESDQVDVLVPEKKIFLKNACLKNHKNAIAFH